MDEPFYQKSSFLSYARKNEGLIERKRNSYIILMLCKKHVNDKFYVISILVDGQKSVAVKCQLWSNVPRSNVSCGQMSRGQMSLAVKRPAVKWHLRSNVPWSNISCGQMSRGQMSVAVKCPVVKCHLRSKNVHGQKSRGQTSAAVKCHISLLRSNVPCGPISLPPSAVKCSLRFFVLWSKVSGQMSGGQMILWSYEIHSPAVINCFSFFRADDGAGTSEILFEEISDKSNIWTRIDFPLDIKDKNYQVVMSGQYTRMETMPFGKFREKIIYIFYIFYFFLISGDMAIDDISFTPKCRFVEEPSPTTTTPSTPKPCPDGKFTCSDGSCIEKVQIS